MHKNVGAYINPFELLSKIMIRKSNHIYVYFFGNGLSNINSTGVV